MGRAGSVRSVNILAVFLVGGLLLTSVSVTTACSGEDGSSTTTPPPAVASVESQRPPTSAGSLPASSCLSVATVRQDVPFVAMELPQEGLAQPEVLLRCSYAAPAGAVPAGVFSYSIGNYGDAVQRNFDGLKASQGECFENRTCSGSGQDVDTQYDRWEPDDDQFLGVDITAPIGDLAADPSGAQLRNAGYTAAIVNGPNICVLPPLGSLGQSTDPEFLSSLGDGMFRVVKRACGL